MRCAMNNIIRPPTRTIAFLLLALGLLLPLAACGPGPFLPTPTAIPLQATVTSAARSSGQPDRPVASATPRPSATEPLPTATSSVSGLLSQLDHELAKATVRGFLDRLEGGDSASAGELFLTSRAQTGEPGQLLADLSADETDLAEVSLVEFLRASDTSYEARAELHWASHDGGGPATQTMSLILTEERGLWLIDEFALDKLQVAIPSPTPQPATSGRHNHSSLDGKLVFQTSSGGDLYTIKADGSGLDRLTDGLDPAWSPDGREIAFSRWRNPWGVYLIDEDGSGEERVLDRPQTKEVTWSPDGTRLAFTINYGTSEPTEFCFFGFCFTIPARFNAEIWVANLQTGELLNLPLDDGAVHAPTWSPTADRIVFAGRQGLAWIDLEDMEQGRFASSSPWDNSPLFSPDGQRIAFMGRVHNRWEIFVMKADGSGRRQLTHSNPELEEPPSNVAPAWSPDGKSIAFLSNRDGPWRIYVMRADGSQQRSMFGAELDRLGFRYEWASERVLSWSPY
jgi:Tol biopolymer transport system component